MAEFSRMPVPFLSRPRQGWQCPVCKRVMAPDFPHCPWCVEPPQAMTSNTSDPLPVDPFKVTSAS